MRTRATLLAFSAVLVACECGTSHVPVDAARDSTEMDSGADAGALPDVERSERDCDDVAVPAGTRCIPDGWFVLSRWTTFSGFINSSDPDPLPGFPRPAQPVYLDAYFIDAHEVTNTAYLDHVMEAGASPPPDECGHLDEERSLWPEDAGSLIPERSGWIGGLPEVGREEHPVVCVTRAEAIAFCEARGGRLPSVAQYMKAGREMYPDTRRFPWGDAPPPNEPLPWPDFSPQRFFETEVITNRFVWGTGADTTREAGQLYTEVASAMTASVSPHGVLGLSGNASELLAECREELEATYGTDIVPVVRPALRSPATCTSGVLVAGANWRSSAFTQSGAPTIYVMRDGDRGIEYLEADTEWFLSLYSSSHERDLLWGRTEAGPGEPADGPGNGRRSWRIGFRCAYDLGSEP